MTGIAPKDTMNNLAMDVKSVANIKQLAKQDPDQALKQSAKQFEAVFINMMLQTMRKASFNSGLLQSHEKAMYTSMFDQQISQNLASKGMGLADMMLVQLKRLNQPAQGAGLNAPAAVNTAGAPVNSMMYNTSSPYSSNLKGFNTLDVDRILAELAMSEASANNSGTPAANVSDFYQRMNAHAVSAQQQTGIPANFILAQAALESGWGQRDIKQADGTPTYNLFGIKANADWQGKVAEVTTTEYTDGMPHKVVAKFRAYDSQTEAFTDYANFLKQNPRYQSVLANASTAQGFAQGLQQAGYATDPQYAQKLMQIIRRIESA